MAYSLGTMLFQLIAALIPLGLMIILLFLAWRGIKAHERIAVSLEKLVRTAERKRDPKEG